MAFWNKLREHFRDPTPKHIRDHLRQQREERRHHEREGWRDEGRSDPNAPSWERDHPYDPPNRRGGW